MFGHLADSSHLKNCGKTAFTDIFVKKWLLQYFIVKLLELNVVFSKGWFVKNISQQYRCTPPWTQSLFKICYVIYGRPFINNNKKLTKPVLLLILTNNAFFISNIVAWCTRIFPAFLWKCPLSNITFFYGNFCFPWAIWPLNY